MSDDHGKPLRRYSARYFFNSSLSAPSMRQVREPIGNLGNTVPLWGRFLRRSCIRKRQSVDQEFFVLLSVSIRPFLPSFLPGEFAAFFTFDPLVLPNLFFDKVGDSVERIGIHDGRDLNVFLGL